MEGLAPPDAEISEENWGQRRKKVMAPSPRAFSSRGVCSKSAAHNPTFPFPRRWAPDDEHSFGTKASKLRPWRHPSVLQKIQWNWRGKSEGNCWGDDPR